MKVLIVGAGEVGYTLAERLSLEGLDVVLVESDETRAFSVSEQLEIQVIQGSGSDPTILRQTGLENTDLIIAVTNQDEINLVSCAIAKAYGPKNMKAVARVRAIPLASDKKIAQQLGIDLIINPEKSAAQRLLDAVKFPGVSELVRFSEGRLVVAGIVLDKDMPYIGKTLDNVGKEIKIPALIAAAVSNGNVVIPKGNYVLEKDTLIYVLTTPEHLIEILEFLLPQEKKVSYVTVAGGTYLAHHLCKNLSDLKIRVKLIESDKKKAFKIANLLSGVLVLHGDPTDMELFEEEGLGDSDLFIAATPFDERNVLSSLLATKFGVNSSGALIRNHRLAQNISKMEDIDVIINPRHAAVDAVLQFIRRGKVHQVTSFPKAENAELMEVEILEDSKICSKPLMDLNLPSDVLIGAVLRGEKVIIPKGKDVLKPKDRVILIALHHAIPQLESLIKEVA